MIIYNILPDCHYSFHSLSTFSRKKTMLWGQYWCVHTPICCSLRVTSSKARVSRKTIQICLAIASLLCPLSFLVTFPRLFTGWHVYSAAESLQLLLLGEVRVLRCSSDQMPCLSIKANRWRIEQRNWLQKTWGPELICLLL